MVPQPPPPPPPPGQTKVGLVAASMSLAANKTGTIYRALDEYGVVEYIGKTIDFERRYKEWLRKGRVIEQIKGLERVPVKDLSGTEQAMIEKQGLQNLSNIRNAVSPNNPIYKQALEAGMLYLMRASLTQP